MKIKKKILSSFRNEVIKHSRYISNFFFQSRKQKHKNKKDLIWYATIYCYKFFCKPISYIRLSFMMILMTFELTSVPYVTFYSGPSSGDGGGSWQTRGVLRNNADFTCKLWYVTDEAIGWCHCCSTYQSCSHDLCWHWKDFIWKVRFVW